MLDIIAHFAPTIKPVKRPFHSIPIADSGEPLVPLDPALFVYETPAPYAAVGAPYGGVSPFMLRRGVAHRLTGAARTLQRKKQGWQIKVFDGYRPIAVQRYMVAYTFCELAKQMGIDPLQADETQREALLQKVYRIWSPPNEEASSPPPHSTGAAVDITLVDAIGKDVDMGSPIDFNGEESDPNYFQSRDASIHRNRELLKDIMTQQGFLRHHAEWWHFSYGDQYWVWLRRKEPYNTITKAIYGIWYN